MFIITGCGRSGTNYLATRLMESGIKCGHESVFQVNGPTLNDGCYCGDSSWFAAPFLGDVYLEAPVLHVVRSPRLVVESFHKIGLCAKYRWRHVTKGSGFFRFLLNNKMSLSKVLDRLNYVNAHRRLLEKYTSVWDDDLEFYRLCEYWFQWNLLIEEQSILSDRPYMRIKLEDVDDNWLSIVEFLGLKGRPLIGPGLPTNMKDSYARVKPFDLNLPDHVKELAQRYELDS